MNDLLTHPAMVFPAAFALFVAGIQIHWAIWGRWQGAGGAPRRSDRGHPGMPVGPGGLGPDHRRRPMGVEPVAVVKARKKLEELRARLERLRRPLADVPPAERWRLVRERELTQLQIQAAEEDLRR